MFAAERLVIFEALDFRKKTNICPFFPKNGEYKFSREHHIDCCDIRIKNMYTIVRFDS